MKPDWNEQYRSLLLSPLGEDLLKELERLRQSTLENAEDAKSEFSNISFTKQASGVRLAIGHLHYLASPPTDEGGKKTGTSRSV